ncbi:UNVERIFIED_CONTAM: ACT domain-containing protein [Kocuria sp. CPCC 205300]
MTVPIVAQDVRRLPGCYLVGGSAHEVTADAERLITVSMADDHTVVEAAGDEGNWVALYTGGTAHDLDTPGMTVSLIAPLSAAGIPIFVASTASADLVLVPLRALPAARSSLIAAGHTFHDLTDNGSLDEDR